MIRVTMSDQQSQDIHDAAMPVEVCDRNGHTLGVLVTGVTAADIAQAAGVAKSPERRFTTQEVLERLLGKAGS